MNLGRTVFSQLVDFLPTYQFQICVDRYQGNRYVKDFSCWDQFLCLAFAQLHVPRKSSRYRSLPARPATQAVSHGFPVPHLAQHLGACQRASRLEDLRRFRSGPDCRRPGPVPRRTLRRGVVRDRVCLGLHDDRFMPGAFSVGKIPSPQERRETAYAAGSARQHSSQCLCDRGPSSRRHTFWTNCFPKPEAFYLLDRGVPGLWPPLPADTRVRLFHHARQAEHTVLATPVASPCTAGPDCGRIKPFNSPAQKPHACIPIRCAAFITSTPKRNCGWFFSPTISCFRH